MNIDSWPRYPSEEYWDGTWLQEILLKARQDSQCIYVPALVLEKQYDIQSVGVLDVITLRYSDTHLNKWKSDARHRKLT